MWKGRVWTERSALSDCCDDGPLSSLILRLNGCLIPRREVEGAWGGCWDPSLGFSENRRCRGGVPTSKGGGVST